MVGQVNHFGTGKRVVKFNVVSAWEGGHYLTPVSINDAPLTEGITLGRWVLATGMSFLPKVGQTVG